MSKLITNPLIGADIEVFLMHKVSGEIVSAEGFVKGTKNEPFNFDPASKYFATSLDNVLGEFCIPPATNKVNFIENIKKSLEYLNATIPDELCTVSKPAAILKDKYLQTENAKLFGCEPDYCVWTRSINMKPEGVNPNLRSAGGHIHVGYDEPNRQEVAEDIIKAMDLFIGIPSVIQEPDNDRKSLYGKAGCFRFKPYGVEYRTISNYYAGDERLTGWVYDNTQLAIDAVNNGLTFSKRLADKIQLTINGNKKKAAEQLIKEFNLQLA